MDLVDKKNAAAAKKHLNKAFSNAFHDSYVEHKETMAEGLRKMQGIGSVDATFKPFRSQKETKLGAEVGKKLDAEKLRYDLLPFEAVDKVVAVLTYGAQKYADWNWQHVADGDIRYLSAALRHISAYTQDELIDEESGCDHLAHAACNLLFIMSGLLLNKPVKDVSDV